MGGTRHPTLHDVARMVGVSAATVSRVLNNNPSVGPEVRDQVNKVLTQLNYEKPRARNKKVRGADVVGLIIPDILNPFFPLLIKGIENIAKIHGYSIILCDSENERRIEENHITNLLEKGIEGLIFIPAPGQSRIIGRLVDDGFPLVFLDRIVENDNINYVVSANEEGAYQAGKYLLSLGHRRIVYIAGEKYMSTERDRFSGFRRACEEAGLGLDSELILTGQHSWDRSYREVIGIIRKGIRFSAIFASSDIMAFGAIQALEDNGMGVPEDVSIIGYDDIPFSAAISLTTVSQPAYEMGKNAMILLIDLIKKRVESPHQIVIRPSMIIRGSCKKV